MKNYSNPDAESLMEVHPRSQLFDTHTYKHTTMGFHCATSRNMPNQYGVWLEGVFRPLVSPGKCAAVILVGDVDPDHATLA